MYSNDSDSQPEKEESKELISELRSEVDLEIAMREQLSKTLEARIAWGLLVQKSLQRKNGYVSQEPFENVALDALSTLETPTFYLLGKDPIPPPKGLVQNSRNSPRKILNALKPKATFLFTRSNPAARQDVESQHHLYVLKCPSCLRTSFTSLQGLLNHARISHNLGWGTHDECIRACAVIDDNLDVNAGFEVAIGPAGVLPGLQTIFQNAVGAGSQLKEVLGGQQNAGELSGAGDAPSKGDYLNETLGLHEDSPALAMFLGKEAVRRQIKVWDEEIDILSDCSPKSTPRTKRHWRMPFSHRNFTGASTPDRVDATEKAASPVISQTPESQATSAPLALESVIANESRFCFIARIVITDRSLSIPMDQMPEDCKGYTHKWMISVDAPSYAHHITTILNSVTVTPVDPSISIPLPPPTTEPPFVVVGVSHKPFLARVELSFSGTSSDQTRPDQKVIFEHWVDLDPIGDRGVVIGEDQVLDVELDKNTVLKPVQKRYIPIDSKSHWNQAPVARKVTTNGADPPKVPVNKSSSTSDVFLSKLTKQYPLTQDDARPPNIPVPYRLVPTQAYFKTLIAGRRKAIEFGRARAIQKAYNAEVEEFQDSALKTLSVAEVYSWLARNGHFIKVDEDEDDSIKQEMDVSNEESSPTADEVRSTWCRICGQVHSLGSAVNLTVKSEPFKTEEGKYLAHAINSPDYTCPVLPRAFQIKKLPMFDIRHLVTGDKATPTPAPPLPILLGSPQLLIQVADHRLTFHIRRLVERIGLSRFRPTLNTAEKAGHGNLYPVDELGEHRLDVEKALAPSALLALVTKSFVRILVERGLEVANRDKILSAGHSSSKHPKGNRGATSSRMLTPTHILSGILRRGGEHSQHHMDTSVLLCLSRLGVAADPSVLNGGSSSEPQVKVEEA